MKNHLSRTFLLLAAVIGAALASFRPLNGQDAMYAKTTYTYKTVGKLAIQADVYRPAGTKVLPAILWIHGGTLIVASLTWPPQPIPTVAGLAVFSLDKALLELNPGRITFGVIRHNQ